MDQDLLNFKLLHLPPILTRTRKVASQRTQIFDAFRNKFVALTPEEWVRQHMLNYLNEHLHYPKNLLGVEVSLKLNNLSKRADIVVYTTELTPWMIIECKAAEVEISQAVFDQAARYNITMRVPFLVVTNGIRLLAARINFKEGKVEMLQSMPDFIDKI
jgi:predicted type IV restriction endonuclease